MSLIDELVLKPLVKSFEPLLPDVDTLDGACKFFIEFRCGFCDGEPLSKLPSVTSDIRCPASLVVSNGGIIVDVVVVDVPLRSGVKGIIIVGRTLDPPDVDADDDDDDADSGDDTIVGIPVIDGVRR